MLYDTYEAALAAAKQTLEARRTCLASASQGYEDGISDDGDSYLDLLDEQDEETGEMLPLRETQHMVSGLAAPHQHMGPGLAISDGIAVGAHGHYDVHLVIRHSADGYTVGPCVESDGG